MAKPMQNIEHHANCSCCGKQASFKELGRRPSGFGPLKSTSLPKKSTLHTASKSPERAGTAVDRRKSLQHGIVATRETSPQDTYDKLTSRDRTAVDIAAEIADDVADRNMLQAKESRLRGTSKDKEALLEECCALKNALVDQLYHLQLHKVHHESVHLEQRRMEIAIEELEVGNGLEAPRTGGFSRLKAKLLGLKCREQEYFATLTTLRDDLESLKKDPRVSFTNEADVERDVFATETRRLQKMVRRLRTSYHKVCAENNEVVRLRENISKLTTKINDIQTSIKDKKAFVEQMKKDIDKAKADAIEAQKNTRNATKKARELESHASVLQDMLLHEKQEGSRIQKQTSSLSEQTRMVRQENADADMATKMAAADVVVNATTAIAKANAVAAVAKANAVAAVAKANAAAVVANANATDATTNDAAAVAAATTNDAVAVAAANVADATTNDAAAVAATNAADATTNAAAATSGKGGKGKKGGQNAKLKHSPSATSDLDSDASKSPSDSEADSDAVKNKAFGDINKDLSGAKIKYLKEIGLAANKFVENAPGSRPGSSKAKAHAALGSPEGDHSEYELVQDTFQKDVDDVEARFLAEMERIEFGSTRPRKNAEEEAKRLAAKLEALKKSSSAAAWLQNFTFQLDGETLKPSEYMVDIKDSSTTVRITSPGKSPEALAKKKAEEEARKKKKVEDATKRAVEDEERRKRAAEEAAIRAKKVAEDVAKATIEADAKKKRDAEEVAKKSTEATKASEAAKARDVAAAEAAVALTSGKGKEFFDDKIQGVIKKNIKEVLGHLETISETVQQKATTSGTAESTAQDVLDKLDKPK